MASRPPAHVRPWDSGGRCGPRAPRSCPDITLACLMSSKSSGFSSGLLNRTRFGTSAKAWVRPEVIITDA